MFKYLKSDEILNMKYYMQPKIIEIFTVNQVGIKFDEQPASLNIGFKRNF